MDIRVYINNEWLLAKDYQIEAFNLYIDNSKYIEKPFNYNKNNYIFTISRISSNSYPNHYNPIFLIRQDGSKMPIANFNDVKVFLTDISPSRWHNAYSYQRDAYFDFIYNNDIERFYTTNRLVQTNYIPINGPNNIQFRISRNDNGSIFYEKNNGYKVRISDNECARMGFQGFWHRTMEDFDFSQNIIISTNTTNVVLPRDIIIETTNNENKQCLICYTIKQNISFKPCNHHYTCSECYNKLQNKNICPICKQQITNIISYTIASNLKS